MDIIHVINANGTESLTKGLIESLQPLFLLLEAHKAARRAMIYFKRDWAREPDQVQVAITFTVPHRPRQGEKVTIKFWHFAATAIDKKVSEVHIKTRTADPEDDIPITLKHLGNGRYGLP